MTQLAPQDMDRLIQEHLAAEMSGDADGAVAVYTDDVEHDVVGWPAGPAHGREAAHRFYEELIANFGTEDMKPVKHLYGTDFCVVEHDTTGTVHGVFMGVPGHGKQITFRLLHVFEFRGGRISRENVWLDGGTAIAQLTAD
jgi:steroid delta-isomerase-like uncharacterized protein